MVDATCGRAIGTLDVKARAILLDAYWSPMGWRTPPRTNPDDVAYAMQARYMFPPAHVAHDDLAVRIHRVRQRLSLPTVRDAFLVSLATRRLDLRSVLGSYAVALHYPLHAFAGPNAGVDFRCHICGALEATEVDLSVLNFERHKWGGVRRLDPYYVAFDLEQFTTLDAVEPTAADHDVFATIIDILRHLPRRATCVDAAQALIRLLPSNNAERSVLIEILSCCGILDTPDHPGFWQGFVPDITRCMPPRQTDWTYPAYWWTGDIGVNDAALTFYFPNTR